MIPPLSFRRRFFYLAIFVTLFIILVPVIILYSTGYRFGKGFSLEQTGGIYVFSGESGTSIFVNDELERETNPFQRGVFVSNLQPSDYLVKVVKDDRSTWTKQVTVLPEQVTVAYPFLVPLNASLATVTPTLIDSKGNKITNPDYKIVTALFAVKPASAVKPIMASSTGSQKASTTPIYQLTRRNVAVWQNGTTVLAEWLGNVGDIPYYFCPNATTTFSGCKNEKTIYQDPSLKTVDFYPGRNDVIIFVVADGIYVTELDTRTPQNVVPLMKGTKLDFRVENGESVFVKKGNSIYKVEL